MINDKLFNDLMHEVCKNNSNNFAKRKGIDAKNNETKMQCKN